ncbi:hypothetical protein CC80DRAFT_192108 [Byssothecium circinans]|uniref:Uncharacterized protein n=1 Tax=Byssothecium circinans TaxID=147558 RepID=A0A6A5THV0_9PLEO|nr:hypothetical protein CC80DRAFT_192108 [Byssothecium circinans]
MMYVTWARFQVATANHGKPECADIRAPAAAHLAAPLVRDALQWFAVKKYTSSWTKPQIRSMGMLLMCVPGKWQRGPSERQSWQSNHGKASSERAPLTGLWAFTALCRPLPTSVAAGGMMNCGHVLLRAMAGRVVPFACRVGASSRIMGCSSLTSDRRSPSEARGGGESGLDAECVRRVRGRFSCVCVWAAVHSQLARVTTQRPCCMCCCSLALPTSRGLRLS